MKSFVPSDYQLPLNFKDHIVLEKSSGDHLQLDVLYVGGGPASLASALKLSQLAKAEGRDWQIGVVEKARQLGGHSLSGALVNPVILKELLPDIPEKDLPLRKKVTDERFYFLTGKRALRLPVPPDFKSRNKVYTASLCEIVRWLGEKAEKNGVHVFPSTAAAKLMMRDGQVTGILTAPMGQNRDGSKESFFMPESPVFAKVVVLAEGSRGHLTQSWLLNSGIKNRYPQTYALGVKEMWQIKPRSSVPVFHSVGWPLKNHTFGGSWFYPLGENLISLGLVVGLDSKDAGISVHDKLQDLKNHPLFDRYLKGGKRLEWGAKTLPEGGWHAVPEKLSGPGVMLVGDSAGFLNMASLKGVHYAMASGVLAAETLHKAFKGNDFSEDSLKIYDEKIKNSFIAKELYKSRNLRQIFQKGLFTGLLNAGLMTITGGRFPKDFKTGALKLDNQIPKSFNSEAVKSLPSVSAKSDGVYLSGNRTRDKIPSHLKTKSDLPEELIRFYERLCPAGVYEEKNGRLVAGAPNCVDCKATDILGPRWQPREGGSGPEYQLM